MLYRSTYCKYPLSLFCISTLLHIIYLIFLYMPHNKCMMLNSNFVSVWPIISQFHIFFISFSVLHWSISFVRNQLTRISLIIWLCLEVVVWLFCFVLTPFLYHLSPLCTVTMPKTYCFFYSRPSVSQSSAVCAVFP